MHGDPSHRKGLRNGRVVDGGQLAILVRTVGKQERRQRLVVTRRHRVYSHADEQPYGGHDAPEPYTAQYGCFKESQAHQGRYGIGRPILASREFIISSEPLRPGIISVQGEYSYIVSVGHFLISVVMPVMRVGILRCARRPSCDIRPVVASSESGSATSIPVISRPSETALTAARASWSAVAAPAETPSSVAVVRIVSGIPGFLPSTTATTTANVASGCTSAPASETTTRKCLGRFHDSGGAAQAVRSVAVTVASC